jgi:superfamily II DNA/RNA helicase
MQSTAQDHTETLDFRGDQAHFRASTDLCVNSQQTSNMKFDELGLSDPLLKAIGDAGYESPTPIQAEAIPHLLMGRDIVGIAQTGTGKTASFTLPMIEILSTGRARARMPRSLILEPTRELAAQVAENFATYGKNHKLNMALLIGGVSFSDQEDKLDRGVDVLIATPGRLIDHFERGKVLLADIKVLVVDEADRMLDMGFIPDVEKIIKLLPPIRQTAMFSATMPSEIKRLTDSYMMNPRNVQVDATASAAQTVTQGLLRVSGGFAEKRAALRKLIRANDVKNAIVFCNRKRDVATLEKSLTSHGFNAAALHGDMHQSERMKTLARFRDGEITLLIASDVAARGLDIPNMSHVFNFDVPMHADDYIHRIGRTGRAGKEGHAFTLTTRSDEKFLDGVERLLGRPIPPIDPEGLQKSDAKSSPKRAKKADPESDPAVKAANEDANENAEEQAEDSRESKAPRRRRRSSRSRSEDKVSDNAEAESPVDHEDESSSAETNERARRGRGDREASGERSRSLSRSRSQNDDVEEIKDGHGKAFGKEEYTPAFLRR